MKLDVRLTGSMLFLFLGTVLGFGQSTTVDNPAFARLPSVSFHSTDETSGKAILIQPGGMIVISKGSFVVDGKAGQADIGVFRRREHWRIAADVAIRNAVIH